MSITKAQAGSVASNVLPRDKYTFRVRNAKHGKSQAGNDNIQLECEIISPETVEVDGVELKTDKVTVRHWLTMSEKAAKFAFEFLAKVGLGDIEELSNDMSLEPFDNLCFEAILGAEERVERGRDGNPITDANGNPVKGGVNYSLANVIGPVEEAGY